MSSEGIPTPPKIDAQELGHGIEQHSIVLDFERPNTSSSEGQARRWREYAGMLERFVNSPDHYLDEGGAAKVFAIGESDFCIKLLLNRHRDPDAAKKYDLGNSASQEALFLKKLADLEVSGVRTPVLYDVLEGDRYAAIVMEQLNAVNLQKVILGQVELPETFEYDPFFDHLEEYLIQMHKQGDVAHGDLFARNIMIDNLTGNPRVIDFGRGKVLSRVKDRDATEDVDWARFEEVLKATEKFKFDRR